jgi:hypothetical protein
MGDIVAVLRSTPLPIILAVGGILFILVAAFGLSKGRQVWLGLIGLLLIGLAILLSALSVSTGPEEVIQIFSPEPEAQVTSPVTVSGFGGPAFEGTMIIEVYREDGELVGKGFASIQADEMSQRGPFEGEVAYSVEAVQPGRISVFMISPRDGRIEHLASVTVVLSP